MWKYFLPCLCLLATCRQETPVPDTLPVFRFKNKTLDSMALQWMQEVDSAEIPYVGLLQRNFLQTEVVFSRTLRRGAGIEGLSDYNCFMYAGRFPFLLLNGMEQVGDSLPRKVIGRWVTLDTFGGIYCPPRKTFCLHGDSLLPSDNPHWPEILPPTRTTVRFVPPKTKKPPRKPE